MFRTSFESSKFHKLLFLFDQDIASQVQAASCPYCGGKLHVANYHRRIRGIHGEVHKEANLRFSFCCGREGCRRRVTPPSVRFLGRKAYSGTIIVLATAMRCRGTKQPLNRIKALFGVANRTLQRWRIWWQEYFPKTQLWTIAKGYLSEPAQESLLPASLLEQFQDATIESRVFAMLRFLALLSAQNININQGAMNPRRT